MDIEYTLIRSVKRKKLTITVERDSSIVVRAPQRVSDEKVHQIVMARRQWLFDKIRHPQKYGKAAPPPGKELVNGESTLYLGRNYPISIAETESGNIEFNGKFIIPPALVEKGPEKLIEWYKQRAGQKILPRVTQYSKQLGVEYQRAEIMESKYCWGSCTVNSRVRFNWRLIKAPMSVIDYVVVHELAHLIEEKHTPDFWNIVRAQVANADRSKNWLKEHGDLLEERL